jgi:hypothetical protein
MSRSRWLIGAVALVLTVQGCANRHHMPSDQELTRYAERMPPLNEPVRYYVVTHCGLDFARIGGHWWRATEPVSEEESDGFPHGWDNPVQEGSLTVQSRQRAVFEAEGTEVVFTPSPDDREPPPCR